MSFWEKKLAGEKADKPVLINMRDLYTQVTPIPQTVPTTTPTYTPAVKTIQGSTCPGCGSTNYRGSFGSYAIACPECGYHPRFEQSGYGEAHLDAVKGASVARQTNDHQTMAGAVNSLASIPGSGTGTRVAPTQYS